MTTKVVCVVMGSHMKETMGGAQLQSHHFSTYAASKGMNVYYLCPTNSDIYSDKYKIVSLGSRSFFYRWTFAGDFFSLVSQLRVLKPDFIYQRGLKAHTGIVAFYCMFIDKSCKVIHHLANEKDVNTEKIKIKFRDAIRIFPAIEKVFSRFGLVKSNYIISQTFRQDKFLNDLVGRRSYAVISNVFIPFFKDEMKRKYKKFTVLWVANLKEQKRPGLVFEISDILAERCDIDIDIVMVGRRYSKNSTHNEFEKNVLPRSNISYMGEKTPEEVEEIMMSSHLFLSTSRIEGYPNTFVQALSYGLPIASYEVDIDGLIENNSFGCVSDKIDKIADYIIQLSKNRNGLDIQSRIIMDYAKKEYGVSNFDKLVSLINNE